MANAQTEHSKKLRAKTSAEHTKKLLAEGKVKRYGFMLKTEVAEEFDAVLAELGGSRPEAIKALCAFYRSHKS